MKFFKVEEQGDDTYYFQCESLGAAKLKLYDLCGYIPESLLLWTEIKKLPEEEEAL